jgi:hypothetical protein
MKANDTPNVIDLTALETSNNPAAKEAARKLTAYLAGE